MALHALRVFVDPRAGRVNVYCESLNNIKKNVEFAGEGNHTVPQYVLRSHESVLSQFRQLQRLQAACNLEWNRGFS